MFIIDHIDFFANHSDNILGIKRYLMKVHQLIFWYLSKKHISCVMKLKSLNEKSLCNIPDILPPRIVEI